MRLKAWRTGPPSKITLLFIHGWTCTHAQMAPLVARLEPDFGCISVDLLGHGDSGLGTTYSIAEQCDALQDALQGLDDVIAIGHSMGGQIALECAARGDVAAAVLLDPAPIVPHAAASQFVAELRSTLATADIPSLMDAFARRQFRPPVDPDIVENLAATMACIDPNVARKAWAAITDFDGLAALNRLERPCLAIFADKPLNDVKAFAKASTWVETAQTACTGHMQPLEAPEQLDPMIRRFIAQMSETPA